jgi:alpha-tubulin suppressor-like RCC1 family protein
MSSIGRTRQAALLVAPALLAAAVGCREDVASPTGPDLGSGHSTAAAVAPLSFRQISTGSSHACGVTTGDRAYCWGTSTLSPAAVATDLRFQQVRAGLQYTCGLTTDSRIYCWGANNRGQLGNGSSSQSSSVPVPVAGDRRYSLLRTGQSHACANTKSGVTLCWGANYNGQLGDGTTTDRRSPRRVIGGLAFVRLSAGGAHTCGVTSSNEAYCWGLNNGGQLGDATSNERHSPNPVKGGLAFALVSAGLGHSCGVTTDHKAYCWGRGATGQLGYGGTDRRGQPIAVAGGLAFSGVSTGNAHTCGVTTAKLAYCWGLNSSGQVGDGTNLNQRLTPVAVAGGLHFDAVLASFNHYTCGIATNDRGYCWGENTFGYLGDGTTENRSTPTAITPPI